MPKPLINSLFSTLYVAESSDHVGKHCGSGDEVAKAKNQPVPYVKKEASCAVILLSFRESMFSVDQSKPRAQLRFVDARIMTTIISVILKTDRYQTSESQSQHNEKHMGHEILPVPALASTDHTNSLADESGVITSANEEESNDLRSQVAMQELASLMLTMDMEEKSEPSFTIPSGKDKYSSRQNKTAVGDSNFEIKTGRVAVRSDENHVLNRAGLGLPESCLAFSGCLSFPNSNSKELSTHHAMSAENILLRCIREHPSDLAVQGLALLAWRELMLENNSMAYTYIAMATGLILHLGLHVSNLGPGRSPDLTLNYDSTTDDYIRKRRTRSFWAYFSVDQQVPINPSYENIYDNMHVVYAFEWTDQKPNNDKVFCNEHTKPSRNSTQALNFALRSATNAAASIARIVRAYQKFHGFADANPQIIDYILSASVIHLLEATSGRNFLGKQSANILRGCLDALVEIQSMWMPQASRAIRHIQELASKWKVVWALPLYLSQRLPASEIPQTHNEFTVPVQKWMDVPAGSAQISCIFGMGEVANAHMYTGFNNDFGALWDSGLFENALEHINLPQQAVYQSSLEWLFDEHSVGL
ncbi:hypothetical protein SBOR_3387 [Sclerotinia borealis F-4128]|uniref:Xylanolytic transcriptional activator regulatory domain-containing protein n=1 Tax=Sclerotinia borealis (strain F-4128) TaxID=1432307 RepID=W9CNK2_SCLBF|nr:hypothetical protein SBOR_3387 [Sclerotinia borealis F-4128]